MTKQEFIDLIGEDPVDMFGPNCEELRDNFSADYPLGGLIEPYDIMRELDLTT